MLSRDHVIGQRNTFGFAFSFNQLWNTKVLSKKMILEKLIQKNKEVNQEVIYTSYIIY